MKHRVSNVFFVLVIALNVASCSNDAFTPSTDQSVPPYPSREIFVIEGDVNKSYVPLGAIEYTLRSDYSLFSDQADLRNQAVTYLKQVALAKYGSTVDALINLKFQESAEDGFFSPTMTTVRGLAVAFKSGSKSYGKIKKKHKAKPAKQHAIKTKPPKKIANKALHKTVVPPEEPNITEEELLK